MKNLAYITFIFSLFVVSCSKSAEIKSTYLEGSTDDKTASPATANSSSNPISLNGSTNNAVMASGLTPSSAPPGMLNPEHGKPGHRCDIPVGQPLNSAPQANAAKPATQQITVNPNQMTATPQAITAKQAQKTAPGMNPPHGEPGHRCDIAVGQPLNSAPAKTSTSSSTVTPAAPKVETKLPATVAAPQKTSISAAKPTAPGMNPPHGEPGHQCDIPVGQPLK